MKRLLEKFTGLGLCARARSLEARMEQMAADFARGPF